MQAGTCTTPGGAEIPFRVGDEQPTETHGLRIFAGQRLDPFFIDLAAESATHVLERLAFRPEGVNTVEGANVPEHRRRARRRHGARPRHRPAAGRRRRDPDLRGHPVRLERMGRPEIKNFILQDKKFDPVNRDLELRDLYNAEDAFDLSPDYAGAYRARLNANLAFFDRLDGRIDWPPDEQGDHPLTELLLADFLVVDTSKPFTDGSFLEIERAVLAGRPHTTCGGRPLNDDIVDILYTLLVGGVDGPPISDGVDQATQPAARSFPYLCRPNPDPPDLKAVLGRGVCPAGGGGIITALTQDDRRAGHHQRRHRRGQPARPDRRPDGAAAQGTIRAGSDRHSGGGRTRPSWSTCSSCAGKCWAESPTTNEPRTWPRQLVRDAPDDGTAWLARARTRATFHRFAEALADLDAAGRRGADRAALDAERAAILQAIGCYAEALVLRRTAAERRPDFTTLGALAVLEAERGEVAEAERLFTEARRRYRGVSPFPVAELDFRRGLMWLGRARPPPRPVPGSTPPCAGCRPTPRRWATSPRSTRPWVPSTPPSTACAPWRCPATTPSTRPPSPASSATPASRWRPSTGASAPRPATTSWCCAIRRPSSITRPTSGSPWVAIRPKGRQLALGIT